MKKTIIASMALALLSAGVLLYSCKKETTTQPQNPANGVSVYENENGKFKKEIVIKDESGKNSLFLAIYSDHQSAIDNYLKNTELKLAIETEVSIERLKERANTTTRLKNEEGVEIPEIKEVKKENSVVIDVVNTNFEKNVKGYSLVVKMVPPAIDLKNPNVNYTQGALTEIINESDFCGVVNLGWGLDILCKLAWRNHKNFSSYQSEGEFLLSGSSSNQANFAGYIFKSGSYRTRALVWKDYYQGEANFKIVFDENDYRGRNCTIGGYDGHNCYYGSPPSGTNAFIFANSNGKHFYYTPVPGATTPATKCPRPGSGFDGSNCGVLTVPYICHPFIWDNNWYVKPDMLLF